VSASMLILVTSISQFVDGKKWRVAMLITRRAAGLSRILRLATGLLDGCRMAEEGERRNRLIDGLVS
jgi:hypothetical protein